MAMDARRRNEPGQAVEQLEGGEAKHFAAVHMGHGEHPLPDGKVWDHLVGQVGRHLRHAARVTGGADPPTLAGEGQEPVVPAIRAAHPRESVGENPPGWEREEELRR